MTTQTPLGMEAFFTADRANEGIRLPLLLPTGERSDHWLEIYGIDSDVFRLTDAELRREGARIADLPKEQHTKALDDLTMRLRASLIKAWSFPEECTDENKLMFLRKAPHLGLAIDKLASNRALFFAVGSTSSSGTPSMSSGSTSPRQKTRSSRGGNRSGTSKSKGGT